jgi:hypothetical protein
MLAVRIPEHRRIYVAVDLCSVLVLCSIHSTACTNERTEAAWTGEGNRNPSRNQGKTRLIRAPSGLIDWPHPHHESAHSINPVPGMSTSGRPRNYFPVIATPAWPLTIIHHACIRSLASRTEGDEKDVCCMRPRPDPIHPPLSCPLMQLEPSSSTWPGSRQRKGKKGRAVKKEEQAEAAIIFKASWFHCPLPLRGWLLTKRLGKAPVLRKWRRTMPAGSGRALFFHFGEEIGGPCSSNRT